jgi:hypothetical protein
LFGFLIVGRGHLQFVFGAIEDQPYPAVARRDFQISEWNGDAFLANIKVSADVRFNSDNIIARSTLLVSMSAVIATVFQG